MWDVAAIVPEIITNFQARHSQKDAERMSDEPLMNLQDKAGGITENKLCAMSFLMRDILMRLWRSQ